jgi:hypothetical protein
MLTRAGWSIAAFVAVVGLLLLVDWQLSKGSVTTRDGVTLLEDNRLRLFQSEAIAGVGFGGRLSVSPEGCVGTTSPTGVFASIIWQHGTSLVSTDPLRVKFAGRTYREGDAIEAGGFEGTASGEAYRTHIPKACEANNYFYLRDD